uniref:Helicase like transcription factor n=1 Tax=Strigops habroptila TaxID=2489341 RepID=A0A672VED3_STRHB
QSWLYSARGCSQYNICRGERNYSRFSSSDFSTSLGLEDFSVSDTSGTEEDTDSAVLYGTLRGSVVGLRYYTGIVNNNEMVALQREPSNPYDKNAVKVNNVNGDQVGHIKKELAAALAGIMDNKLALIEGVVPYGAKNAFTMPVQMSFWGREENKEAVLDQLKRHGFKLAPPLKGSECDFASKWISARAGPSYSAPVHAAVQLTPEQLKSEFDKLFEDLKEDDKTCELEGAEAVATLLLPHQKQALAWMVSRENSNDLPPFWEERSNFYYNTLTNFAEKQRPKNVIGGILADDMGLVILTELVLVFVWFCLVFLLGGGGDFQRTITVTPLRMTSVFSGTTSIQSVETKYSGDGPSATLIVCPLSVLSNWIDQFEQHIHQNFHVNIYVYYGSDRSRDPSFLSEQDIVLTTYNILATDYGVSDSPLHKVTWLRIVLDEGHTIRNPNAQQTKAALNLDGHRRWVLTGTPIQNSVKDLWSLISFLKLKPFTDREWWHRTIQRPVTMGAPGGLGRLQSLIRSITLRRTKKSKIKGKPVLELPERKVLIQHITLTEEERQIYQSVKKEGKAAISRFFSEGTVLAHYADILGVLLRLRQLCCHPRLCINTSSSSFSAGDKTPEEVHEMLVNKMKLVLSSGSDEECAVCLESLTVPVITRCAHVFCRPCIFEVIRSEQPNAKCPLCRSELRAEHLVECPLEGEIDSSNEKKSDQEWISSSKINALMHALIELRRDDPTAKCLVVSQFTTFLSLIENPLKESGFAFTRLDGSMAQKKRVEAIQCFQSSQAGSPTVMLLSLKAGGVGLNLTAASRVFLMDPAWNPAAEDQCFDRCHRLGQKHSVVITKFIVKDSVEENMLKIQKKKRELAAGAFATKKPSASEIKQTKINEIKALIDL